LEYQTSGHYGVGQLADPSGDRAELEQRLKMKPITDDSAYAIYIASRYRSSITNAALWSDTHAIALSSPARRRFAEQSIAAYPNPTEQEVREATTAIKPWLPNPHLFLAIPHVVLGRIGIDLHHVLFYAGIPALITALLSRGGLVMYIVGVAVVTNGGARASRLRVFLRTLIAWAPVVAGSGLLTLAFYRALSWTPFWISHMWYNLLYRVPALALLGWVLLIGLLILSMALPARSLQDRMAGTWLVPR